MDLESTNGSFINNTKIEARRYLPYYKYQSRVYILVGYILLLYQQGINTRVGYITTCALYPASATFLEWRTPRLNCFSKSSLGTLPADSSILPLRSFSDSLHDHSLSSYIYHFTFQVLRAKRTRHRQVWVQYARVRASARAQRGSHGNRELSRSRAVILINFIKIIVL